MKRTKMVSFLLALILTCGIFSLASCSKEEDNLARIYVNADEVISYLDIDPASIFEGMTLYDFLRDDETMEADIDRSTNPDTILSVCNVYAGSGEQFVFYSSDASDATEGAPAIEYDGNTLYRVDGNYMATPIKQGCKYLIRLEKIN